jgi:hypothetical protein
MPRSPDQARDNVDFTAQGLLEAQCFCAFVGERS